jgi:hypothetical protein
VEQNSELATALGKEYIIKPDIVVGRYPVENGEINHFQQIVDSNNHIAVYTPFREHNSPTPHYLLHASVSCKWTLRSDRGQNDAQKRSTLLGIAKVTYRILLRLLLNRFLLALHHLLLEQAI